MPGKNNIAVVILAAGEGKRMGGEVPKVLQRVQGKPLVEHVVQAVEDTGWGVKPIVVVSARHTQVQEALGGRAEYAVQTEQLGTGHAVLVAEPLWRTAEQVLVFYGDMPFITPASITRLAEVHRAGKNSMTFMTVTVPNFEDSNKYFFDFGRIVRDSAGRLVKNVQLKDATEAERGITELDTSYMCFDTQWLRAHLPALQPNNMQKEYYLTDLLAVALAEGAAVGTVPVPAKEAIGVNTMEQLHLAHSL